MPFTFPKRSDRHPQRLQMFQELAKRIPSQDARMTNAVQSLVGAYKDLTENIERSSRDETATPGAKLVKIARAARSRVAPLVDELDAAVASVAERQAHLRSEIEKVYNPPGKSYETVLRHQEIRAHFRRMPRTQALQAIEKARQAGDEDTLTALVSYQSYLSNLPDEIYQHARGHLVEAHAPEQAKALTGLAEQAELVGMFRSELAQSVADLVDFNKADEIIAAAQLDTAD